MFNCDEHVNGVNTVSESVMPTYGRLDVAFTKGAGVWLFDDKGEKYLDALSGIAVCNLGHSHPNITSVSVSKLEFYSTPQIFIKYHFK